MGEETLSLGPDLLEALRIEAASAAPQEACGVLFGHDAQITSIQPARNIHSTPETHFEIDPQTLIDAHRAARHEGPEIIGYYHSHPNGLPQPSATDRAMSAGDDSIWAIIGAGGVEFWRDAPSGFEAIGYTHPGR